MPTHNKVLLVHIPSSLDGLIEHIADFFDGMLHKLDINSHKKTPTSDDIPQIIEKLRAEVIEFEEQFQIDKFDPNSKLELADTANFAFLAYVALRLQGVQHGSNDQLIQGGRGLAEGPL
jgi:hypothetical protein